MMNCPICLEPLLRRCADGVMTRVFSSSCCCLFCSACASGLAEHQLDTGCPVCGEGSHVDASSEPFNHFYANLCCSPLAEVILEYHQQDVLMQSVEQILARSDSGVGSAADTEFAAHIGAAKRFP